MTQTERRAFVLALVLIACPRILRGETEQIPYAQFMLLSAKASGAGVRERALHTLYAYMNTDERLPEGSGELLAPMLQDPDADVRYNALLLLPFLTVEERESTVSRLVTLADNGTRNDRVAVAQAIKSFNGSAELNALLHRLLKDTDTEVRQNSLRVVAAWGEREFVDDIKTSLEAKNSYLRADALAAVAGIGIAARTYLPQVQKALSDPDWTCRTEGIKALGALEVAQPTGLGALFTNPKDYATEAERDFATRKLVPMLDEDDESIRAAAVNALSQLGDFSPGVVAGLEHSVEDVVTPIRVAAVKALTDAPLEDLEEVRAIVLTRLQDPQREVRAEALKFLNALGPNDASVGELLTSLENDPHPSIQGLLKKARAVIGALSYAPGNDSLKSLATAAGEDNKGSKEFRGRLRGAGDETDVVLDSDRIGIAIATWCPHSRNLVEALGDPVLAPFLRHYHFVFLVGDERKHTTQAISELRESGEITQQRADEVMGQMGPEGTLYVFDRGWLDALPGEWYSVEDTAMPREIPMVYDRYDEEFMRPERVLPALPLVPESLVTQVLNAYDP